MLIYISKTEDKSSFFSIISYVYLIIHRKCSHEQIIFTKNKNKIKKLKLNKIKQSKYIKLNTNGQTDGQTDTKDNNVKGTNKYDVLIYLYESNSNSSLNEQAFGCTKLIDVQTLTS